MKPDRIYWGAHDERPYMLAEIADLRADLAAQAPQQSPNKTEKDDGKP